MQIDIKFKGLDVSDALVDRIHREVEHAVSHCHREVTRVHVHLGDVNGPKTGADKRCLMEARAAGQQPVAVESHSADLYQAVNDAAAKLERVLERRVERLDDRKSQPRRTV